MSVEKSELKAAFAHAMGCDADDDLEAARRDSLRYAGRLQAAGMLELKITQIIAKLKKDMDEEDPPFRQPEDYKKAASYLSMCLAQAMTLKKQSDNLRLQMQGKVMAFEHTIKRLVKVKTQEAAKIAAVQSIAADDATGDGPRRRRPLGTHPGHSIATIRRAEALMPKNGVVKKKAKKKKAKKATKKKPKKKR